MKTAWHAAAAGLLAWCCNAHANLPPRTEWRSSASAPTTPAQAPALAVDGDPATRWGGAFKAGDWWQLDLGRSAEVGGVLLHWDSNHAAGYRILVSEDARQWTVAFETQDGLGGHEVVVFPATRARYLRLASRDETSDHDTAVFEFEPLAAPVAPRLLLGPDARPQPAPWPAPQGAPLKSSSFHIELPRPLKIAGLEVAWASARRGARLEARTTAGAWRVVDRDTGPQGASSTLAAPAAFVASGLRLQVEGGAAAVRRLRLLGENQVATPLRRLQQMAARVAPALAPPVLLKQQVYWTVFGTPGARQKSLLDEYGTLEPFKGGPTLQPLWRDAQGSVAAHNTQPVHRLREGWMPMPALSWSPRPGLHIESEAFAVPSAPGPVTLWRHRLSNTGSLPLRGRFDILLHPLQVSPPWQRGGLAQLRQVALQGPRGGTQVHANGRLIVQALSRPDAAGAGPWRTPAELQATLGGALPKTRRAQDPEGLAGAVLRWQVNLAPGAARDIVLAAPLGDAPFDTAAARWPALPALEPRLATAGRFDALASEVADQWRTRLGRVGLKLPQADVAHLLRAQAAYILVNQSGPAMQPGPRNYDRAFIRDGSASAVVLARLGQPALAREFLRWYATHAVHDNGLVSPILNADGSVHRGFGSDIEYDSQGQFVNLVAEIARLDGGPATVRDHQPQVHRALRFLAELRNRTLVSGYESAREAPERFRGLLAPSISHEGYSVPTHSYWDNHWALRGWQDGIWLAEAWGDAELAAWSRAQYAALRESVAASVRATMAWKRIDYIPASADLGDPDPTSVSIALDPAGQADLLPAEALALTFDRYVADVAARSRPGSLWAYTPYEWRNLPSLVRLQRPQHVDTVLQALLAGRRPAGWQVMAEVVHSRERFPGYIGDMPHTWVGAEAVRALLGLLLQDEPSTLQLLRGTPPAWFSGEGLSITALPTSHGRLSFSARLAGAQLQVTLGPGLRAGTPVHLSWPAGAPPRRVRVDGVETSAFNAEGIALAQPFGELEATW